MHAMPRVPHMLLCLPDFTKYKAAWITSPSACAVGLDVLDVMRGLDIFAACFAYSAATHSFVQRPAAAPPTAAFLSVRPHRLSSCWLDNTICRQLVAFGIPQRVLKSSMPGVWSLRC
jgi:hypothetical protein